LRRQLLGDIRRVEGALADHVRQQREDAYAARARRSRRACSNFPGIRVLQRPQAPRGAGADDRLSAAAPRSDGAKDADESGSVECRVDREMDPALRALLVFTRAPLTNTAFESNVLNTRFNQPSK